jgi:hypothetical protein
LDITLDKCIIVIWLSHPKFQLLIAYYTYCDFQILNV